jgi:glucose-6-phosphate isomerase
VPDYLIPHRSFTGNRPSMSILLPELDAFTVGQLLSLYEHRVAVQVRGADIRAGRRNPGAWPCLGRSCRAGASGPPAQLPASPTCPSPRPQGFIWNVNSFDQWGVELGKVLATKVRSVMNQTRTKNRRVLPSDGFNSSTMRMMNKYLEGKTNLLYPEPRDVFPVNLLH